MKSWKAMIAGLLLAMFVASSCATLRAPVVEEEEVEQEQKSKIQEWLELQDMDLWRPWRSLDPGRN